MLPLLYGWEDHPMPTYRFYRLGPTMHVAGPGEDREFDGDVSALEHARRLANGHAVGVWEGTRLVADVAPDNPRGERNLCLR